VFQRVLLIALKFAAIEVGAIDCVQIAEVVLVFVWHVDD